MAHRIEVRPFGERHWQVSYDVEAASQPMLFRSGAKAESAARRLARRLAAHGEFVETVIILRDGSIASRS